MKKIILILLVCFCLLTAGCSYGEVGLVQNANGSIKEYYYIPIPEKELSTCGVTQEQIDKIIIDVREECTKTIFDELITNYQKAVGKSEYSFEEKAKLISGVSYHDSLDMNQTTNLYEAMKFEIVFASSTCYKIFKQVNAYSAEDKVVEKYNYFFTSVTKTVKDPIFDKIATSALTTGKIAIDKVNQVMGEHLGEQVWEDIKTQLNYNKYLSAFNYFYVVPTARIHSNADSITKDSYGNYHHRWTVNLNNINDDGDSIIKIEYWTVTANRAVWYVLALVFAGGVIAVTYLVAKNKENKKE
ncbi:MAG: hypothetical protein IJW25_01405, partial [Clostridia bacterium]|nr:hypothetical protein [Clostridia bacterium]